MALGATLRSVGLAVALAAALSACQRSGGGDQPPESGDKAVARVDGRTIWVSDVKREAVAQGLIGAGEPLDASSDLFRQMMDEVIDQKLLAAEAQRRKLDKDPVAMRKLQAAHDRVLGDILVDSTVADAVTEANIKGLYDEQQKLAKRGVEIHARQIVLATPADVEAVRKLIAAGGSFEALAMEKSRDQATRFNGGDMGYFTADVMPEAYAAALKGAKAGQVIGPVPVTGGYALVRIEDVRDEQPVSLDAARPQIVRFLTYDRIRDLLEKLRSKAKVELLVKPEAGAPRPVPPADAPPAITPPAPVPPASAPSSAPAQKGAAK